MSGDVQPRKRKDKKKKKDELGVDDPRGTAAVLGEGDVFIHSQHDHGTGGHWCAKIIFFSLLAVLITLIGLIILENRGLTELEANSVESRYSGVLDGWLEDASDDHHDEHTLELKHHDIKGDDDHLDVESDEDEIDQDTEESQEDNEIHEEQDVDNDRNAVESNEDEEQDEDSADDNDNNESEEDLEEDDANEEEDEVSYARYNFHEDEDNDKDDIDEDDDENDTDEDQREENNDDDEDQSKENNDDDENQSKENNDEDEYQSEENNDDDEDQSEENKDDDGNQINESNDDDQNYEDNDDDENYEDSDDEKNYEDDDSQTHEDQYDNLSNEINDDESSDNEADKNNKRSNIKFQKYSDELENEDEVEQEYYDQDPEDDNDDEIEKIEREINREIESEETVGKNSEEESSKEDISEEVGDVRKTEPQSLEEDDNEPPLEHITMPPAGRPFVEIEEETPEKPINTLAEEEEYEKRQTQLRKEEEAQGTQMWLKLAVGGALLVATHAVLRRATAPRDVPETEEHAREETPVVDRRMTLVAEKSSEEAQQESLVTKVVRQVDDDSAKTPPLVVTSPLVRHVDEEEVKAKKAEVDEKVCAAVTNRDDEDEERYSEEEDLEDEEEEKYVQELIKVNALQKVLESAQEKPTEESEPEDVEIIDDEEIEEEQEEDDEDEEEISDVDDTELLTRLEAKYGRLPEPERPGQKHKDGGNSVDDDWPGEPSERYWRAELDRAEDDLRQGAWSACEKRVNVAALANSGRARWLAARALDMSAEAKRDNGLLSKAIAAYIHLLKMNERLSDKKVLEVAQRTIDRIQFRGTYLNAEPIYRLLIRRFPDNVNFRNNLTVSFLMANRADLADEVLKETLLLWPKDRVALAHHGFVLKNQHNKLEEAVQALYKALEGDTGPANEPRFYYHLGDALLLLGRFEEAHEVHKRGAALGHFLSPSQRSLYNVPRLKSRPWWSANETPYAKLIKALEQSWRDILKEGEAAKVLYEKEKEGLKERGEWSQLDIFARGSEIPGRCSQAPVTCSIIRSEPAAAGCRRGQVKFSAMSAGTHVRPHVGPTNCRLRMHLGLTNTKETYIRVDKETRQWQVGKTFIFDDSFEHEVWHNGTGTRLVLIVDVWHPELTAAERRTLPAI